MPLASAGKVLVSTRRALAESPEPPVGRWTCRAWVPRYACMVSTAMVPPPPLSEAVVQVLESRPLSKSSHRAKAEPEHLDAVTAPPSAPVLDSATVSGASSEDASSAGSEASNDGRTEASLSGATPEASLVGTLTPASGEGPASGRNQ